MMSALSRRDFLTTSAATGAALALGSAARPAAAGTPLPPDRAWLAALGKSLPEERNYVPRIEGRLPAGLRGRLYRNGPGLFERGGHRKRNLLDGDGMIQRFDFTGESVRYANRFVHTKKFVEEEAAGEALYRTWTTRAPGGFLANLGAGILTQAGVTTVVKDGVLLALDEVDPIYALDPDTLRTTGPFEIAPGLTLPGVKAHTKTDGKTGDWTLVGTEYGPSMTIRIVTRGADGTVKARRELKSPRMTYLHDFFVTERHVVLLLHPVEFSPFAMLAGFKSFTDSLTWSPAKGNRVLVVEKEGDAAPVELEAPTAWMWHSLNAHEAGRTIVADFVGYENPDHFIGENPFLEAIMVGERGRAEYPGKVRRHVIDLSAKTLREEIVSAEHHEFPIVDPRAAGHTHRFGYFAVGAPRGFVTDGVVRIDMTSGARDAFRFGPKHFVGEPVFAPSGPGEGEGWLLAQVQSGETGTSFLAIFDARRVADGPIAKVHLTHHVPLSFHGTWQAA